MDICSRLVNLSEWALPTKFKPPQSSNHDVVVQYASDASILAQFSSKQRTKYFDEIIFDTVFIIFPPRMWAIVKIPSRRDTLQEVSLNTSWTTSPTTWSLLNQKRPLWQMAWSARDLQTVSSPKKIVSGRADPESTLATPSTPPWRRFLHNSLPSLLWWKLHARCTLFRGL